MEEQMSKFQTRLWICAVVLVVSAVLGGCSGPDDVTDIVPGPGDARGEVTTCQVDGDCQNENACVEGACEDGVCVYTPADKICDDGDPCTDNDLCSDGKCKGEYKQCDDAQVCNGAESCDPDTGECLDGTPPELDDGVECTVDKCDEEADKVTHTVEDELCDDENQCTLNTCDEKLGCTMEFIEGPCDDEDPCTVDDACDNGVCIGVAKDCADSEFCNGEEQCDPDSGECVEGELLNLDDELDCTVDDCDEDKDEITHTPDDILCDDGNQCTQDICDPEAGCDYLYTKDPCEDGEECTIDDVCLEGVCTAGEWICFEDCANNEDDDKDDLVDCVDPDCTWDLACLPDGQSCETAYPLNQGEGLVMNGTVLFEATTVGKTADFEGSCSGATADCADTVHVLTLAEPLGLSITIDFDGQAWPAIYILDAECTKEKFCAAASSSVPFKTVAVFPAGVYHIVVDGAFAGDESSYVLQIETFAPAQTEAGCTNGLDDDADGKTDCADDDCAVHPQCQSIGGENCDDAVELFDTPVTDNGEEWKAYIEGDTDGMANDLGGSCDPDSAGQADQVFTFVLQDPMWLTASHDFYPGQEWPALYLLDAGCAEGLELACATEQKQAAELSLPLPAGTYFLVADAAYPKDKGPFILDVTLESLPDTETDCGDKIDDDLDGLTDCDDDDCQEDVVCVGFPGDNCKEAFPINDGKPIGVKHAGVTFENEDTTVGLLDDYSGPCDEETDGSPDLVYSLLLESPMVVALSHDFDNNSHPAIYILDQACDDDVVVGCATAYSGAAELQATLAAGLYYIVLDGAFINLEGKGDEGPFHFSVTFYLPPESEVDCFNGIDDDVDGLTDCDDIDCEVELYCQDPYEPNDTQETAYGLGEADEAGFLAEPGTMVYPEGDEDWFGFDVPEHGFIEVALVEDELLDARIVLLDANGTELVSADEPESIVYGVYEAGTYYVKVAGFGATSVGGYGLTVALSPPTDTEGDCTNSLDDDLDGVVDCDDDDCDVSAMCGAGDSCDEPLSVNGGDAINAAMTGLQLDYEGSTVGYSGDHTGGCSEASAEAADAVWTFTLESLMNVQMVIDYEDFEYPSLYVLKDGCDGEEVACGAGDKDPLAVEVLLEPGIYYVVVDGNWAKDESVYTLSFVFTAPVLNETNCSDGLDDDQDELIDCCDDDCFADEACLKEAACDNEADDDCDGVADCDDDDCSGDEACFGLNCEFPLLVNSGTPIQGLDDGLELVYQGDTTGMGNNFDGSCSGNSMQASDAVWKFELQDDMDVTISHDYNEFGYPALYLFSDSCSGDEAGCVTDTADAAVFFGFLEAGDYYVIIDGDFPGDAEPYTVTFLFQAPTETECKNGLDDDKDGNPDCTDEDCKEAEECLGETCLAPFLVNDGNPVIPPGEGLELVYEYEGDTTGKSMDLAGSCEADSADCPDDVWMFVIDEIVKATISHDFDDIAYPAVYLLAEGCTELDEVGCASAETGAAVVANMILQPGAYYVVVDGSFPGDENSYTLVLTFAAVPDQESDCGNGVDDDGDGLVDCCDNDCDGNEMCYEFDCGDGVDNDCDLMTDCDDTDCNESGYCTVMALPFMEQFEHKGKWADGFVSSGPDEKCQWEVDMDGAVGSDYSMHMGFAACSEEQSYNLYTPKLDVSLCAEVTVQFFEKGMFSEWTEWHGIGIDDGVAEWADELPKLENDGEWTAAGPYIFDVTDLDVVRIYFAYMGDNADDWWVDEIHVECSDPLGGPECEGNIDITSFRQACQEGLVDATLSGVTVTYVFDKGYFLQDETGAMEVYVGNDWPYVAPAVGDVVDLHVTEYGSYANHQEVTASDAPVVTGQGDIAALSTDISAGTLPSEGLESFLVTGAGFEVSGVDGQNITLAYGSAAGVTFRVDDVQELCVGAVFDLLSGVVTQWYDIHRLQSFDTSQDLANVNTDNCEVPEQIDDSNWDFEEVGDEDDPPADFEKATSGYTALVSDAQAHLGAQSCELTWDSTGNQDFYQGLFMPVQPSQMVTFVVWVLDDEPAGRVRQFLRFYDENKQSKSSGFDNKFSADSADWVEMSYSMQAPEEAAFVRAYVRMYDYGANWDGDATVYVDDWNLNVPGP